MMKTRYGLTLMALAVVGFLALPALAMPSEKGCAADGSHFGMHFMLDNVTEEDLNNMTMAEIRELKQKQIEKMNNMTLGQIKELMAEKQPGDNTRCRAPDDQNDTRCHAQDGQNIREFGPHRMGGRNWDDGMSGPGENAGPNHLMQGAEMMPLMMGFAPSMMMDDLSEEELNNMTLAEIRELRERKRQEMENMTLGQIKELQQKKMQVRMDKLNNTTLGELRKQGKGCFAGSGKEMRPGQPMGQDGMAGRQGMHPAGTGW